MKKLDPVQQKFILHWGEMGARWGINRTMAQVHALLFISPKPLNAEDIVGALGVARSNVSNSLRELQGWGIVRLVHILGDKRDHFESIRDVWELFRIIMDERKRREIDPTCQMLEECIAQAADNPHTDEYTVSQLKELREFMTTTSNWYTQVRQWPTGTLVRFLKLGGAVAKLLRLGQ